jgi:hypothetical protein
VNLKLVLCQPQEEGKEKDFSSNRSGSKSSRKKNKKILCLASNIQTNLKESSCGSKIRMLLNTKKSSSSQNRCILTIRMTTLMSRIAILS